MQRYPQVFGHSTIARLDADFEFEGALMDAVYWSQIYAIARRLVRTAVFLQRRYPRSLHGDGYLKVQIVDFIKNHSNLQPADTAALAQTLFDCVAANGREISSGTRKAVIAKCVENGSRCRYCGCELDFEAMDGPKSCTLDHVWPIALGGSSEAENLVAVCRTCNRDLKKDFIDYRDSHYEHICEASESFKQFVEHRPAGIDHAIRSRSHYKCHVCRVPAHLAGELSIARLDSSDSFHFTNLAAFCGTCIPEHDRHVRT